MRNISSGFVGLVLGLVPMAGLVFAASNTVDYSVRLAAGSDWVGDGGPARDSLLLQAEGVAAGTNGNLFISDAQTHRVREITAAGIIRTVAGTGQAGYSGDGGPAADAQLNAPYGLAVDAGGNLYIADLGNAAVRRVARDGRITTVAGLPTLRAPRNVAVDSVGFLYVSDFEANRVYKLSSSGAVSTVAGTLSHPAAVAVDKNGAVYIGDTGNHLVRKVEGNLIRTIAQASAATGLAFDSASALYVADAGGGQVVRVPATGPLTSLPFAARDIAVAADSTIYTTDGHLVRRVFSNGSNIVIAGRGDPARGDFGLAIEARLNNPSGVAVDPQGSVYIADRDNHRVRRVDAHGVITTFAGTGLAGSDGDGGMAAAASLHSPAALSFDKGGNLFIDDRGNHRFRSVTPGGVIRTVEEMPDPIDTDAAGNRYFIDATFRVGRVDLGGAVTYLQLDASIGLPTALTVTADGVVYVTDIDGDRVWQLSPARVAPVALIELVNSASLLPGPVAPGMLVTLRGMKLKAPEIVFGKIIADILTVSESEVVVLAPVQLAEGPLEVEVRDEGVSQLRIAVTITAASPGLFAVAVNEDGSLNSSEAPVARGSIVVLFGTGQGVTSLPVLVRVGGYPAEVLYSGPVAGFPGLWQVNARVPAGYLGPGELPVSVSVGEAVSPSVTLSVN